ncbi:MAG: SOS response-associated peptidase [Proteobacteria bacterium]|nr:SOS response-associated peptidase [Pseudomonadota bacterium]
MCGRFTLRTPAADLAEIFAVDARPNLAARYNIAPGQDILVVRAGSGEGAAREFAMPRWGLVPHWAKDPARAARMINARAESLAEKPSFRDAYRRRRCLVAADGFYEWRKAPDGTRQPYHIRLADGAPFAIAGLWESWSAPGAETLETCALITTEANLTVEPIHHRMPVILPPAAYQCWLDARSSPDALDALLRPYAPDDLVALAVASRVNNARHDDAACLEAAGSGLLL